MAVLFSISLRICEEQNVITSTILVGLHIIVTVNLKHYKNGKLDCDKSDYMNTYKI
jgi:hypothetical protein